MSRGVVLITGASAGLGEEMARQFADLGYDLALCARRTERLDALAAEITARTGRRVETAALDVTDADAVPAVFDRFAEAFGSIDRVVVNAGIGKGAAWAPGGPTRTGDRHDQLRRRADPDRGGAGDLPAPAARPPRADLLDVGPARHAQGA